MQRKTLAGAVGICGVAGLGVGMAVLFGSGPPPAPPRPRPPSPNAPQGIEMRYSATMYRALIEQDAKAMGVVAPTWGGMMAVFPYFDELSSVHPLRAGGVLRSRHLRLSLGVRRVEGAVEGQSFRADHLVLKIENTSDSYLSYRVSTRVPAAARCEAKGVIPHDAIALRPHETILRTECLFQKAAGIDVTRVEVIEVPQLSYHYVSRLIPALILYDPRTAAGHAAPKGAVCPQTFSWRDIRDGAQRGDIAWRDIVDFYARHNCDEYAFFPGYRYRTDAEAPLPARPAAL
jgi:hypothetical protein